MPTSEQKRIDPEHREVARFCDEVYYRNASGKAKPSGHLLGLANRLDIRPGQTVLDIAGGLVTCLGSLEHFLDQPAALLEMKRVVKPGGRLVILVPNAGFLTHRLGLYRGTHQQAVKETIRTLDVWGDMFKTAGLEVRDRWRDLHILEFGWIVRPPWLMVLPRLIQALVLPVWPLDWQ